MHKMRPEEMGELSGSGDGVFKGAEAERSKYKLLGEDVAGIREQGAPAKRGLV